MVAVLFVITLLASGGVGAVYMITKEPIAVAQQNATREALKLVLPPFDATVDEALEVDELPVTVHTATAADQVVGYAVESMTKNGFSGVVRLMVGFTPTDRSSISRCSSRVKPPAWEPKWPMRETRCCSASRRNTPPK